MTKRWVLVAMLLAVSACSDGGDGSAGSTAPPATALVGTTGSTVTVLPSTTGLGSTVPSAATSAVATAASSEPPVTTGARAAACAAAPVFDPTASIRDQFVDYLTGCGFTAGEAACLFDHLDFTDPAVTSGDADAMLPAFEACAIDADRVFEIGGT